MPYFYKQMQITSSITLDEIARNNGFSNPGPIFYFPLNQGLWEATVQGNYSFPSFTVLSIPVTSQYLQTKLSQFENQLIQLTRLRSDVHQMQNANADINTGRYAADFFTSILLLICSAGMSAAAEGAAVEMDVVVEALQDRAISMVGTAEGIASTTYHNTTMQTIHYLMRHFTGIITPSWWSDVGISIIEWDADIFWDGSDAVHERLLQRSRRNIQLAERNYRTLIEDARNQLACSFYTQRI